MIAAALLARLRRRGQARHLPPQIVESTTRLGDAARRLIDDPVLRLAFEMMDDDIMLRWQATALGDERAREALYRLHVAIVELQTRLRGMLNNSAMLEAEQRRRDEPQADWAA